MPMFVSGRVAITAAGVTDEKDLTNDIDVIFIRAKMDFGTRNKVVGEAATLLQQKGGAKAKRPTKGQASEPNMKFDVGDYQTALLIHNVLEWHGPSFRGVACIRENIVRLDPDEPLVARVIQEISDRNTKEEAAPVVSGELDDPNVIEVVATAT